MPIAADDFTPEDTLVAIMIAVMAADGTMRTAEMVAIERIVDNMPAFGSYESVRIKEVANTVYDILAEEEGLDILWTAVRTTLPERLFDTAYALSCDVAASDGRTYEGELAMLEEMRHELNIDRLVASAIEVGARARHRTVN